MIPTKQDIEIQGTLPGEDVQMTLDTNSLAHLMSVMTNLYSDKVKAIVREYATNAWDSHVEAGVKRPIEVSTPTDFKPFFTVRDYGVGMDAETIRNVYSRYGASTKRGTNSQNGMLGLGSKSALTYTTQFKVTGVKNGIKTYVVVSRTADGSGVMKIISQSATEESNGVTIEIPVTDRREIENVAYNFFRFWKPGTVLLNGKDPSKIDGIHINQFVICQNLDTDYIVMGNVAYPVPQNDRIYRNNYSRTGAVAYVDMGKVNFTPSRESLHMTALTKATLQELRDELARGAKEYIEEKIANAPNHTEALKNFFEIQATTLNVYATSLQYKGSDIPTSVAFRWFYHINAGTTYESRSTDIKRLITNKCLIIHGYEYEKIHTTHRQKIRLWLDDNGLSDTAFVYISKSIPKPEWLESIPTVHWDDVKAVKLNRPKTDSVKNDLFDIINERGQRVSNQNVDTKKTVIYSSPTSFASDESKDLMGRILASQPDVQLVLVNKNKWNSFKKDFPKSMHVDDAIHKIIDDYLANLTEEEKLYLKSNWQDRHFCARLDPAKILDPVIKTAVKSLSVSGLSDKTVAKYELMTLIAYKWGYKNFPKLTSNWSDRLFEQYSLLDVYGHRDFKRIPIEHIYLYMNTAYKANLINH